MSGKIAAHWLTTGLPVVVLAPLLGAAIRARAATTLVVLARGLLLGTPILSLLGAIGAALTLGARGGGSLLALLVLPLYVPVLIFGAGAVDAVRAGLVGERRICRCWARDCCWRAGRRAVRRRRRGAHRARLMRSAMSVNWFKLRVTCVRFLAARSIRSPAPARRGSAAPPRCSPASGSVVGLVVAPTDAQQGDAYRIIFIHVPAAWMSMFIYLVMAVWSALALGFNTRLSAMMAQALAPTGALMAVLALWTGAFWGRPTWGTYWAWDARMTSS